MLRKLKLEKNAAINLHCNGVIEKLGIDLFHNLPQNQT